MEKAQLKKKKYTMQDIADAVGVSKATVSYVLNGKENSRVSEETRDKILHVANLYNYTPNFAAKYLSSNVSNFIGIIFGGMSSDFNRSDFMEFMDALTEEIEKAGDSLIYIHRDDIFWKKKMSYPYDVLIAVNVSKADIEKISKATFSPLLLVDSLSEDPLFFQVITRYEGDKNKGKDGILLAAPMRNELYRAQVLERFEGWEIHECEALSDVKKILEGVQERSVTVLGRSLGETAAALAGEKQKICVKRGELSPKIQAILVKIQELKRLENLEGVQQHVTEVACE